MFLILKDWISLLRHVINAYIYVCIYIAYIYRCSDEQVVKMKYRLECLAFGK